MVDLCSNDSHLTAVRELFSIITSPLFSDLVVKLPPHETRLPLAFIWFRELRRTSEARRFKSEFSLEVPDPRQARRELLKSLESVTAEGLFDFPNSRPTVRITRPRSKSDPFDFY